MATIADIRAAIVATLTGVAGVGVVQDHERYAAKLDDLASVYIDHDGKLRGWFLRRVLTRERSSALGVYTIDHRWSLNGILGFEDAIGSELAFDDLIEAIRDAFRADDSLGHVVDTCTVDGMAGIQVDETGPVMFAGVLAHRAKLTLTTRHVQ